MLLAMVFGFCLRIFEGESGCLNPGDFQGSFGSCSKAPFPVRAFEPDRELAGPHEWGSLWPRKQNQPTSQTLPVAVLANRLNRRPSGCGLISPPIPTQTRYDRIETLQMPSVLILLRFEIGDSDTRDSRASAELRIVLCRLCNTDHPVSSQRGTKRA